MKIVFLTNNESTLHLAKWLQYKEGVENVIICNKKLSTDYIESHKINYLISYNYYHIVNSEILQACKYNAINLHISLLPWNRGNHPNIWSFVYNTPKGVTIHKMDEDIDTGDILLQKELFFNESEESFFSSYEKLNFEISELFKNNWDDIKNNKIPIKPQVSLGSYHFENEFEKFKQLIDFNKPISEELKKIKKYMNYEQ